MSLTPEIRRKLSSLHRGVKERRDILPAADAAPVLLEDVLPGRVHVHGSGKLYICEREVGEMYPAGKDKVISGIEEVRSLGIDPASVLFLDIETCGLANCPLFLVGIMSACSHGVVMRQLFARDYSEEEALLAYLAHILPEYSAFVTFNGKSFDIPYIRDRMVYHRIGCEFEQEHLDLLHMARRLWKKKLPDCKLQTLETHICKRRRIGDTPGHLIPEIYHDYVRTGDAAALKGIFHHNVLDIITMAELLSFTLRRRDSKSE